MKKLILIISIIFISSNLFAQFMENPNRTSEKHPFIQGYAIGFVSGAIVNTAVYAWTKNRYISYASSLVASVAVGWAKTNYDSYHGGEFANVEIIHSTLGGITNIFAFHIVMGNPKPKKKLIEF